MNLQSLTSLFPTQSDIRSRWAAWKFNNLDSSPGAGIAKKLEEAGWKRLSFSGWSGLTDGFLRPGGAQVVTPGVFFARPEMDAERAAFMTDLKNLYLA